VSVGKIVGVSVGGGTVGVLVLNGADGEQAARSRQNRMSGAFFIFPLIQRRWVNYRGKMAIPARRDSL
jgi:hypothetical protein